MFGRRNLFTERSQFPMGYPHSPGANIMRAEANSFSGLGGCAGCAKPSGLGALRRHPLVSGGLGSVEGETALVSGGLDSLLVLNVAGAGLGAYHGYKRSGSAGWALVWGAAGFLAPIITVGVGAIQGFAKPERR